MSEFHKGQEVWCYNYAQGLFKAEVKDCIIYYNSMNLISADGKVLMVNTKEIFKTKELASYFATAINYKRGWLKREMETNPSTNYENQLKGSIEIFPEMYI